MTIELKVLKAVLLLRKINRYSIKEDEVSWTMSCIKNGLLSEQDIDDWIIRLKEDLPGTPGKESEELSEHLAECEAEQEYQERMSMGHVRDEWDDLWDDRARSVGAYRW